MSGGAARVEVRFLDFACRYPLRVRGLPNCDLGPVPTVPETLEAVTHLACGERRDGCSQWGSRPAP